MAHHFGRPQRLLSVSALAEMAGDMRRWTRDDIAMEILQLYASGGELNYSSMAETQPSLLRAATRHFGSWRSAVEFAGLSYDEIRKYRAWSRARIIARIVELHRQNADLSWRNVSEKVDPQLAAAATKPRGFGSWQPTRRPVSIRPLTPRR